LPGACRAAVIIIASPDKSGGFTGLISIMINRGFKTLPVARRFVWLSVKSSHADYRRL